MQIAQRLFQGVDAVDTQGGLITYHRTDSTTLSDKALQESARVIRSMFGGEYYDAPRRYQTRVKNAQEAHEAIRPTNFNLTPSQLEGALDIDEQRIYELIWKRTMASQMVDARVLRTSVEISAKGPGGETAVLTASGKAIEFAGFRRAYVEGSDDPAAELEEQEAILPQCQVGDQIHAADRAPEDAIALLGIEPKEARDLAARAVHGSVAHQGARASRDRQTVNLRADDRHDRPPRLRRSPGQGAGAQLHGVRGDQAAARSLRRLRRDRLHRGDGRGS
jgi:DNA topoisomerase-1